MAVSTISNGKLDYSTSEQCTGEKWVDGRPIYRKTFYISALPNYSSSSELRIYIGSNVNSYVKLYGMVHNNTDKITEIPIPCFQIDTSKNIYVGFQVGPSTMASIFLAVGRDRSNYSGYLTVEYTKY